MGIASIGSDTHHTEAIPAIPAIPAILGTLGTLVSRDTSRFRLGQKTSKTSNKRSMSRFDHHPSCPSSSECQNAYSILCYAHEASTSLVDMFETVRRARAARGTPTDEEQDLLRAMVLFASAGLDAAVKQLVTDALPRVMGQREGAKAQLSDYVQRRLKRVDGLDHALLARLLVSESPQEEVVRELVSELTAASLQSTEQLLRVAAVFDIPSQDVVADTKALKAVFETRNQIAHEMDIDFSQPNRNRRPRAKGKMIDATNAVFEVAACFLQQVDVRVKQPA